jgi:hypothetical protein
MRPIIGSFFSSSSIATASYSLGWLHEVSVVTLDMRCLFLFLFLAADVSPGNHRMSANAYGISMNGKSHF